MYGNNKEKIIRLENEKTLIPQHRVAKLRIDQIGRFYSKRQYQPLLAEDGLFWFCTVASLFPAEKRRQTEKNSSVLREPN